MGITCKLYITRELYYDGDTYKGSGYIMDQRFECAIDLNGWGGLSEIGSGQTPPEANRVELEEDDPYRIKYVDPQSLWCTFHTDIDTAIKTLKQIDTSSSYIMMAIRILEVCAQTSHEDRHPFRTRVVWSASYC